MEMSSAALMHGNQKIEEIVSEIFHLEEDDLCIIRYAGNVSSSFFWLLSRNTGTESISIKSCMRHMYVHV
jgi:hypothetical protein